MVHHVIVSCRDVGVIGILKHQQRAHVGFQRFQGGNHNALWDVVGVGRFQNQPQRFQQLNRLAFDWGDWWSAGRLLFLCLGLLFDRERSNFRLRRNRWFGNWRDGLGRDFRFQSPDDHPINDRRHDGQRRQESEPRQPGVIADNRPLGDLEQCAAVAQDQYGKEHQFQRRIGHLPEISKDENHTEQRQDDGDFCPCHAHAAQIEVNPVGDAGPFDAGHDVTGDDGQHEHQE